MYGMVKMQRACLKISMALLLWILGMKVGLAQDQSQSQQSMLPEIDPQDIEIRSDFQAQFPGLRRQPILGFEPAREAYQIDPNRMPYLESEQERMANPPITSLSRPEPPVHFPYQYPQKHHLFSRIGLGMDKSTDGELYADYELGSKTSLGASVNFGSSESYLNRPSSYRDLDASLDLATRLSKTAKLDIFGGVENGFHYMPAWEPVTPASYSDDIRKERMGYRAGARIENWKNSHVGWNLEARYRHSEYKLKGNVLDGTNAIDRGIIHFKKQWTGNKVRSHWVVFADGQFGSQEDSTQSSNTWNAVDGGLTYEYFHGTTTRIKLGGGAAYTQDVSGNGSVYILPRVKLEHWLSEPFKLEAALQGHVKKNGLYDLNQDNRFIGLYPDQKPSYQLKAHGEARYEFYAQSAVWVGASWQHIYDYSYFRRTMPGAVGSLGPFDVHYANADIRTVYAGISHDLIPDLFWLQLKGYVKGHDLKGFSSIPFKEKLGLDINGSLRYEGFTVDLWTRFKDERYDPDHSTDLSGYVLVGSRVEYALNPKVGIYLQGNNLLDQQYEIWQGYQETPLRIFGGITLRL